MKWCLISLVLVILSSGCMGAALEDTSRNEDSSPWFLCPIPEDIAPCVCLVESYASILDCSAVSSNSQLAEVFKADFPEKNFGFFRIINNEAVTALEHGLNNVTFEDIYVQHSNIELVSKSFIQETAKTLYGIIFLGTRLSENSFPFSVLEDIPNLDLIDIRNNDEFSWIPPFRSQSLFFARFLGNNITNLDPGTFDEMPKLNHIELLGNQLTELKSNCITITPSLYFIDLNRNAINVVEPNAFLVQHNVTEAYLTLRLEFNSIEEIREEAFGNVFPYLKVLHIRGNPLRCGCDIAWIVTNPTYLNKIYPDATCQDGVLVHDLDPAVYADLCF